MKCCKNNFFDINDVKIMYIYNLEQYEIDSSV